MHSVLEGISEEEFLTGPDPEGKVELDIDWIFGKSWDALLAEMKKYDPDGLLDDEDGIVAPSDIVEGYTYRPVRSGLLLIAPSGEVVGGYLSCDVSIAAEHQGKGLGKELIAEHFLRNGDFPTWYLDTAAYTPDGERAHRAAYRLLCDQHDLVDKKLARLEAAEAAPAGQPDPVKPKTGLSF